MLLYYSPVHPSRTMTRLRYQLGDDPALLCHNCTLNIRPRLSANLQHNIHSFTVTGN